MISLDNGQLTMNSSSKAIIRASITMSGTNTTLPIEIVGDFKDIPANLHQFYMQAMLSSYGNVNVYNNTDKEPMTIAEQKREWRLNKIVDIICKGLRK